VVIDYDVYQNLITLFSTIQVLSLQPPSEKTGAFLVKLHKKHLGSL